ncbi:hypothetical protein R3W88_004407 [Solanum pinnatisectum]|uniref:NB-ARC domain-containing protein n=1 Tax=Solanum pinnatisectum TaxID=50273 RepID=A0AAV9KBA7_9SOLN|nr:hypothetical protein R3W88_004407 [Solanum pinnatisectum]
MAYASLISLMTTIKSLLMTSNSPMQSLICDHKEQLWALHEKVSSLGVFLNNFEKNNVSEEMTYLEVQVKEVASAIEYTIQLRVTEFEMANTKSQNKRTRRNFHHSLQQVAVDIDRVTKESTKIPDKGKQASEESLVQDFSSSANDVLKFNNSMVGRGDQRERLLEDLTRGYSGEPKVIPIIGMGGIGKTTLAIEVYNDARVRSHFDVCAWATLSQQHNVKEILLNLLRSTKGGTIDMTDEAELADMLHKSLYGKRYLIVMDDIWSSKAWDDVRRCFPSQNKGSRILLTTRNNEVACYANTENLALQMSFMDQDESWNLFKSVAFANEALPLPSEFENIGKKIAEKSHGLPLTIVVVAGLLKSKKTIEDWESVAEDVKSFVNNDPDEQCSHVLGLSYNHLTSDLKTCLLYFGIFPEDTEIPTKHLKRFWMAEGFLNFESDLEGEAEKCLQDLINRCLVHVSKKSRDETKIISCKVHDLIYDLCLRQVQRGNLFIMNDILFEKSDEKKAQINDFVFDCDPNHVPSVCQSLSRHNMQPFKHWTGDKIDKFPYGLYRALLTPGHHQLRDDDNNNLLKRTRSIFFSGHYFSTFILKSELTHFKLLKILDLEHMAIYSFPLQILSLIWLRYLALCCLKNFDIPPEICRLWNLQTFIVRGYTLPYKTFPEQIWGLRQLRYLKLQNFHLPNQPSVSVDKARHMSFSNIQSISYLSPLCCTKEVLSGIQNVKKIGFNGDQVDYESFQKSGHFNNLVILQQLESLSVRNMYDWSLVTIPTTLKKLKLFRTYLSWSYLDIIAELPNLEVLKLMFNACRGKEWDPNVSVFTQLKLLLIEVNSLKSWKATNDNFPVLERLVLRSCYRLKEIPIEFADINTLQLI